MTIPLERCPQVKVPDGIFVFFRSVPGCLLTGNTRGFGPWAPVLKPHRVIHQQLLRAAPRGDRGRHQPVVRIPELQLIRLKRRSFL